MILTIECKADAVTYDFTVGPDPQTFNGDYELEIEQATYTSPITLIDGVGTALFPTINSYLYWNTEVNYKLTKAGVLIGEGTTLYVNNFTT